MAITHSEEEAREAVQEAFTRAVRARESFSGRGELEAWLWRTVTNVCLDLKRGQRAHAELETERSVSMTKTDSALETEVRDAVGRLPERQRHALFLRYYADLQYDQIAYVMGIERGTVAATLHAAHAALRQAMKEVAR